MTLGQINDCLRLRVVMSNNHHNHPQHSLSRDTFCILGQHRTGQDISSGQNVDCKCFNRKLFGNQTCNRVLRQLFCTGIAALGQHICS